MIARVPGAVAIRVELLWIWHRRTNIHHIHVPIEIRVKGIRHRSCGLVACPVVGVVDGGGAREGNLGEPLEDIVLVTDRPSAYHQRARQHRDG